jgi:hypothetical protein
MDWPGRRVAVRFASYALDPTMPTASSTMAACTM